VTLEWCCNFSSVIVLAASAKQPQHKEEHINEIKVQSERAEDAELGRGIILCCHLRGHAGYALRIESGQAGEDQHTRQADDEFQRSAGDENVDDHGDQQSDHAHHQERAHLGEVDLGGIADDRHGTEQGGGRDERQEYRPQAERQHDDGKREPVQRGIHEEQHGRDTGGDLVEAEADAHHQADLGEHRHDQDDRVHGEIDERRADRDVRKAGCDQHPSTIQV